MCWLKKSWKKWRRKRGPHDGDVITRCDDLRFHDSTIVWNGTRGESDPIREILANLLNLSQEFLIGRWKQISSVRTKKLKKKITGIGSNQSLNPKSSVVRGVLNDDVNIKTTCDVKNRYENDDTMDRMVELWLERKREPSNQGGNVYTGSNINHENIHWPTGDCYSDLPRYWP